MRDSFSLLYKGNESAIRLAEILWQACQFWDDLVDKDKDISAEEINAIMLSIMVELPLNPVYKSMHSLPHHIYNVFLRWRDSTAMESDLKEGDREKCYMLRAGIYDLFVLIAAHLYGDQWAQEVGVSVRRWYGEKLDNFLES